MSVLQIRSTVLTFSYTDKPETSSYTAWSVSDKGGYRQTRYRRDVDISHGLSLLSRALCSNNRL